jgi:hypothetical protein
MTRLLPRRSHPARAALLTLGGEREQTEEEILREVAEQLSTLDAGPGLGGGEPPRLSRAGWRTDFSRRAVSLDEIQSGRPGKDGIPPIDEPRFLPSATSTFWRRRSP